jgi:hypothetical protein
MLVYKAWASHAIDCNYKSLFGLVVGSWVNRIVSGTQGPLYTLSRHWRHLSYKSEHRVDTELVEPKPLIVSSQNSIFCQRDCAIIDAIEIREVLSVPYLNRYDVPSTCGQRT